MRVGVHPPRAPRRLLSSALSSLSDEPEEPDLAALLVDRNVFPSCDVRKAVSPNPEEEPSGRIEVVDRTWKGIDRLDGYLIPGTLGDCVHGARFGYVDVHG